MERKHCNSRANSETENVATAVESTCPCMETCPLEKAMSIIGGKWKLSILCSLSMDGPLRYNALLRKIGGISNAMLAKCLRELEQENLVERVEYLEVPVRVEYSVTDRTKALVPILVELAEWAAGTDVDCVVAK